MLLRQQIKKKLLSLTPDVCSAASQKITTKITKNPIFVSSQNIACYIPVDNEIDVWPIIEIIWQQKKNCFLPTLDPKIKNHLQFIKFCKNDKLIISKYNIPEPEFSPEKTITAQDLDLAIVPLLGFNHNCFRLGRGAGCYDRTFEFKKKNSKAKPYLLGAGYKWQQIEFEPKPWDVPMDEITSI